MRATRSITNRYPDFQLLGLGRLTHRPEGHGPYMVVQEGADPADPTMRPCLFALTRRGTWLHCYVFLMLPRQIRRQVAVYESVQEVMALADSLPERPLVETLHSLQDLLKETGFKPAPDDDTSEALLKTLQEKHHEQTNS